MVHTLFNHKTETEETSLFCHYGMVWYLKMDEIDSLAEFNWGWYAILRA